MFPNSDTKVLVQGFMVIDIVKVTPLTLGYNFFLQNLRGIERELLILN